MRINKNQFINPISGNSLISEFLPYDEVRNHEGIHIFDDYCLVHIVYWEPLSPAQEKRLLEFATNYYGKELENIELLGDGEYKFKLVYAELC